MISPTSYEPSGAVHEITSVDLSFRSGFCGVGHSTASLDERLGSRPGGRAAPRSDRVLIGADDQPVANAQITVSVFPAKKEDGKAVETPVGATVTDANGRFEVVGTLMVKKHMLHPDGSVALQVHAFDGRLAKTYQVLAYPPKPGSDVWKWERDDAKVRGSKAHTGRLESLDDLTFTLAAADPGIAPPQCVTDPCAPAPTPTPEPEPEPESVVLEDDYPSTADKPDSGGEVAPPISSEPIATGAEPFCYGQGNMRMWIETGATRTRYIPIQRFRTRDRSSVRYEWTTTAKTKLDVAFTGSYTEEASGGTYSGGFSYSEDQDFSTGMNPSSGNNVSQLLRVQWKYKQSRLYCPFYDGWRAVDQWRWDPSRWTSGNDKLAVSDNWTCDTKWSTTIASPVWTARAASITFARWFSMPGVSLRSNQTNSSSHKLTFTPDTGVSARLCGSNDWPIYAAKAKEIAW